MRTLITLMALKLWTLGFIPSASAIEHPNTFDCTITHVKEAIEINRKRRELYRQDGNADAAKIMNRLIFLEKIMLPFSAKLDRLVRPLQKKDVPMWCLDLVSMDNIPHYQSETSPPLYSYQEVSPVKLKQLRKFMRKFEFDQREELYAKIEIMIEQDLSDLHYNCLTRHFLEAAARSLLLAPSHLSMVNQESDQALIKKSVKKLIRQMSYALNFAIGIDQKAAPIQQRGVPVLCQEMPPVPW